MNDDKTATQQQPLLTEGLQPFVFCSKVKSACSVFPRVGVGEETLITSTGRCGLQWLWVWKKKRRPLARPFILELLFIVLRRGEEEKKHG